MRSLTWSQVRARRLERSHLACRAPRDALVDVVRDLNGVQAQLQSSAELQLAARVDGLTRGDVRRALWETRELVKAWTTRGTLHLHPADELPLWLAARRALKRGPSPMEAWRDPQGVVHPPLEADEAEAVRAAVWDVLDGRCLLRDELVEEVVARVGPAPRARLRSGFAFFLGDLCHGPPQGARITLARPDQWVSGWRDVDDREALAEVCRRFLSTYGPARPRDLSEWLGAGALPASAARTLFVSLGDALVELDVEGHQAYCLANDAAVPAETHANVRLLPEYDAYVLGFREREQLVPGDVRDLVATHGKGRYEGPAGVRFVLVNGRAAGLWERSRRGRRVDVRAEPAHRLTAEEQDELGREAEHVRTFLLS